MRLFQAAVAACLVATATFAVAQESGIRVRSIRGRGTAVEVHLPLVAVPVPA